MNYGIYAILTKGSNYSQSFVWETGQAEFIPIFTLIQLAKVVLDSVRLMNYGIYAILTKGSNYSQAFVWDHFPELIHSSPECKNNFSRQYQFTQL